MEKEAKLILNGKIVTQVEHHGVQQLGKKSREKTAQVDFEVDCPPPADSPPGDLLITMVKETVIKIEFGKNEKSESFSSLSLI